MSKEVFELLHLSDLHLSSKSNLLSIFDRKDFKKNYHNCNELAEIFNYKLTKWQTTYNDIRLTRLSMISYRAMFQSTDLITISGDLATTGTSEDLEVALNFLHKKKESSVASVFEPRTLQPMNCRYFIVPGNHDRYISNLGGPNSKNFDNTFNVEQRVGDGKYWHKGKRINIEILKKGNEKLAIIGADFTLLSRGDADGFKPLCALGQGRVYEKRSALPDLKTATKYFNNEDIPVIWVIHFPPFFKCRKSLKLKNGDLLISAALKLGVDFIIAGHQHEFDFYTVEDVNIIVASSATSLECINGFNQLHFEVKNKNICKCSIKEYEYSLDTGDFDFKSSHEITNSK